MYRIDNSANDGPYQGIHIFDPQNKHIITFWEDDAPVHDFNQQQRAKAYWLVDHLNKLPTMDAAALVIAMTSARFPKPHERIKL